MRLPIGLLTAVLLLVPAMDARAQVPDTVRVREVVVQLFDAMRSGDGAALGALFHPDATMKTVTAGDGEARVRHSDAAGFVRQVGAPRTQVWDERIANLVVHVDGPFATAWMDYAFYVAGTFSHCGVNAFELIRTSHGWRVLGITDTRRQTECRVPGVPGA
jgi:hypothetical protein